MTSLTGQLLIAMPQMEDPFFARSVVYLCAHSIETGAMGLVINKTIDELTTDELYAQLKIEPVRHAPQAVHFGGPVASGNGFVLHSLDYREEGTLDIGEEFAMTATLDILRAKARGEGPRQSLLALGYAGWGPGQLDAEIGANGWLSVAADSGLVFETQDDSKWQRALAKLGVSPAMLSGDSGRA
jgi:putative transcriptional regulator